MSRRRQEAADQAAMQASEAGRVLQSQRGREDPPEAQPEKSDLPRPAPRNEPRRLAMEEIEQRDLQTKGLAEAQPKPEVVPDPDPPKPEEALKAPETPVAAPEPVEATPVVEAVTPPETVRVKVDGEVFDVPKSEVDEAGGIVAYQKIRASENRVAKLNESTQQLRQQQAQMLQWMQRFAPQQQQAPTLNQIAQAKMDIIRNGSPEESAAAMSELLSTAMQANRVDPNAIEQRTLLRFSMMNAAEKFKQEFADVMSNPKLAKLAAIEENERIASLREIPDWNEFYRSIGNELRALTGPKPAIPAAQDTLVAQTTGNTSPNPAGNTSQPTSVKEARKSSIVALPTAASRAELPKEQKQETRDDILNSMRKARGIPTG